MKTSILQIFLFLRIKRIRTIFFGAVLLLSTSTLIAQKPIDSLSFATDGRINTTVINEDALYIGGDFLYVGKKVGTAAFFFNGSSEPDYQMPVFGDLSAMDGRYHNVKTVEQDGLGGWFVGGAFKTVNGRKHIYLVHLLSDKEVDESFSLPFTGNATYGHVAVLKKDGNFLYVGGQFEFSSNGETYKNVFRIHISSLTIDNSWTPSLSASTKIEQIEIGEDKVFLAGVVGMVDGVMQEGMVVLDKVHASRISFPTTTTGVPTLHLMGDTLLMGVPYFPIITPGFGYISGGISFFNRNGKLLTDSTIYGKFYAGISDGNGGFYTLGNWKSSSGVFHINKDRQNIKGFEQNKIKKFDIASADILLGNNSLYVTNGEYHQGVSISVNGHMITALFKLDATTGAIDPNFRPNPNGEVFATLLKGDTLFVAGSFSQIAGVDRTGLAAINANTGEIYDWDPSFDDPDGFYLGFGDHHVSDLKIVNNKLYASGIFMTQSHSGKNISSLVRYDLSTGSLDTSFYLSTAKRSLPDFTSMAYINDKLYVVGDFELDFEGATVKNIGILNIDTKQFQVFSNDFDFEILDSQPFEAQGTPKIKEYDGVLYISGYITKQISADTTRYFLASIDEATMNFTDTNMSPSQAVYSMAFNDGVSLLSGAFYVVNWYPSNLAGININTKEYVQLPLMIGAIQHAICFVSSNKYLFIGSSFEKFGDSIVNGLVRLKRKDLSISHFNHQISNAVGPFTVGSMALGSKGLYVAGIYNNLASSGIASDAFSIVAGKPRQNICLLNPETAALESWNPPAYNAQKCKVFAFGNDVALSGTFTLMPAKSRPRLAKIDLKTKKVADWSPNIVGYYAYVRTLLVSNDTLFVGGVEMEKVYDKEVNNLFALSKTSGTLLDGFAPEKMDGEVSVLFKKGNKLYVGGSFKNVGTISHNQIVRINSGNGTADAWNPQLEGSWNMSIKSLIVEDTNIYIAGISLGVSGETASGIMLKVDTRSAALNKVFPGTNYAQIGSLAINDRGDIVAGMLTNDSRDPDFYRLDKTLDTLKPILGVPHFAYGIKKIKPIGNYFLVAGNHIKEKGTSTNKPGLFVFDPVEDTVTAFFSKPVITKYSTVGTIAANDKTLVFGGSFAGMNENFSNANLTFMKMPDLHVQPGVTSWSPREANNADPFAVSVFGSGFTQNTKVSLVSGNDTYTPDSLHVANRKIIAYFNGADFTVKKYDLKVELSAGQPLLFADAINIRKGEKAKVWMDWTGPDQVLANKPTTFYLSFGNSGNRAAYGVFLYLGVGPKQNVEWPKLIKHLQLKFDVDWDTVPSYVDVDYFLGEPFHGKVYSLFIPYIPADFTYTYSIKLTTSGTENTDNDIMYAISEPLYDSYDELVQTTKSTDGIFYSFFRCAYDVVGIVADLTPGVGCVKSFFDNTVIAGADKYMSDQEVTGYDVTNSIGMIALGCVPGGAELGKAYKISKEMVEMGANAKGAFSSCKDFIDKATKDKDKLKSLFSHDPNAKYGPSGRGSSIYVKTKQAYQYMITFENDSAASAPAQRVIITDTLDKNVFNINSFKPLGFGFGDTTYFYQNSDGDTVDIDLRPDKQAIVRVFYKLSPDEGILTWTFLTLDPNTYQLTDNVNDGFLPPNKTAPEGEGNVFYSISPLQGLADSTTINNSAQILFDWNETIPTGNWHNITDNTLPESAVKRLPAKELNKNFTVNWGGTDIGSGIYSYTVYVAEDDSAYYVWIPETHDTSAVFSGEAGVTYKFYSLATDSAGNRETAPETYDAITQVSGTGIDNFGESNQPEIQVYPNPARGHTTIGYALPQKSRLRIDLLNSCGRLVKELYSKDKASGKGTLSVDVSNLPAGFYFVRILTGQHVQTRKLIVR